MTTDLESTYANLLALGFKLDVIDILSVEERPRPNPTGYYTLEIKFLPTRCIMYFTSDEYLGM